MGLDNHLPGYMGLRRTDGHDSDSFRVVVPPSRTASGNAELRVDQRHPFFFDHSLDHVSGMLLVTSLLDLVRSFDTRCGGSVRIDLTFSRICELDSPVTLFDHSETGRGIHAVRAIQGDREVCGGIVELVDGDMPAVSGSGAGTVVPIVADLVRRQDPRNVLIGEPKIGSGTYRVPLVHPPAGHFLLRGGDDRYAVEDLVECGRQLLTVVSYGPHGKPPDTNLLWMGLTAELPVALPRAVPVELCWPVTPPRGNNAVFDFSVVARDTGQVTGTVRYMIKSCTPGAYRRLRRSA
jgi:hypothetical protein